MFPTCIGFGRIFFPCDLFDGFWLYRELNLSVKQLMAIKSFQESPFRFCFFGIGTSGLHSPDHETVPPTRCQGRKRLFCGTIF
jgi:hypothetical protein